MNNLIINAALGGTIGFAGGLVAAASSKQPSAAICVTTALGVVSAVALTAFTSLSSSLLVVLACATIGAVTFAANSSSLFTAESAALGALFGAAVGALFAYVLPAPSAVAFINGILVPVYPIA